MRLIAVILFILIVLIGVSFATLNADPITVNYIIGEQTLPIAVVMLVSLVMGVVLGFLVMIFKYLRLKSKMYSLERKLRKFENKLSNVKELTAKDL